MLDLYLNPAGCWDFVSIMAASGNGCKRVKQTPQTPKRKVKFNTEWTETYPCIGKSAQGVDYARCTLCVCDFAVSSGGRTDVRRHVETARHKRMAQTVVATKGGMGQYVAKGDNAIDGVTKAETRMAYWLAYHNLPMSAAEEYSRMVASLFPDSRIAKTYSCSKCLIFDNYVNWAYNFL